jgi:hypothetical protein
MVFGDVAFRNVTPPRPTDHLPKGSSHGDPLWTVLEACWSRVSTARPKAADVEISVSMSFATNLFAVNESVLSD